MNVSTFRVHPPGDLGREANVVGVGFEREAEDRNTLPFYPQSMVNLFEEAVDALFVDVLGGLLRDARTDPRIPPRPALDRRKQRENVRDTTKL